MQQASQESKETKMLSPVLARSRHIAIAKSVRYFPKTEISQVIKTLDVENAFHGGYTKGLPIFWTCVVSLIYSYGKGSTREANDAHSMWKDGCEDLQDMQPKIGNSMARYCARSHLHEVAEVSPPPVAEEDLGRPWQPTEWATDHSRNTLHKP